MGRCQAAGQIVAWLDARGRQVNSVVLAQRTGTATKPILFFVLSAQTSPCPGVCSKARAAPKGIITRLFPQCAQSLDSGQGQGVFIVFIFFI